MSINVAIYQLFSNKLSYRIYNNSIYLRQSRMSDLALRIASKDEIKVYKKKIQILKDAVKNQRKNNENLDKIVNEQKQKNWKIENELKKKQQKNQILLVQIRQMKDALVVERNQKQKLFQQLQAIKRSQQVAQGNGSAQNKGNTPGSGTSYFTSFWK